MVGLGIRQPQGLGRAMWLVGNLVDLSANTLLLWPGARGRGQGRPSSPTAVLASGPKTKHKRFVRRKFISKKGGRRRMEGEGG